MTLWWVRVDQDDTVSRWVHGERRAEEGVVKKEDGLTGPGHASETACIDMIFQRRMPGRDLFRARE